MANVGVLNKKILVATVHSISLHYSSGSSFTRKGREKSR